MALVPSGGPCSQFKWTITNKCATCGKGQDDHPLLLAQPDEGCIVDHRSIPTKRLVGDDGWEWSRCPACNRQVEPSSITGEGPQGSPDERGRGSINHRHLRDLGFIRWQAENDVLGGPDDPDTWLLRHPEDA